MALCSLFGENEIILTKFGCSPHSLILKLAFEDSCKINARSQSLIGKVWWVDIDEEGGRIVQKNIISLHYRLLDKEGKSIISSFNLSDIEDFFGRKINDD